MRALGNVCRLRVSRNALASIGGTPIALQQAPGCAAGHDREHVENTLDGTALASPAGYCATDGLTITVANAARMPRGESAGGRRRRRPRRRRASPRRARHAAAAYDGLGAGAVCWPTRRPIAILPLENVRGCMPQPRGNRSRRGVLQCE
ncbi:putative lipodomain protein [Burkholderia thailandensis]|nr:putative lipodomain protein [Burkholderia thailandensis]